MSAGLKSKLDNYIREMRARLIENLIVIRQLVMMLGTRGFMRAVLPSAKANVGKAALAGTMGTSLGANMARMGAPTGVNNVFKREYHEKVIDHYTNPRNVGSLKKGDTDVGTGLVGAPACGDVMRLQIQVDDETGKIKDVRFKTFGCGSAIASSSYLTELVKGMSLEDAMKIKNTAIAKELSLPPVKLHCSMLAEDAIKSAVKDYRSRRVTEPTLGPEAAGDGVSAAEGTTV